MNAARYAAVDLGAGSGRVIVGAIEGARLSLDVLHRFDNGPQPRAGYQRWDAGGLFAGIEAGLARLVDYPGVRSVGVDTWGVDYGLLDAGGQLLEDPFSYRDARTDGVPERVFTRVPRAQLFARTGLQVQQFNTLYQLFAHVHDGSWPAAAARLLLMPDLFHHWLCGAQVAERTIASTTQLLRAGEAAWDDELFTALGLPLGVMPPLVEPGTELGALRPALAERLALSGLRVVAPAAHDTASAVVGTPLRPGFAYISSGTWSLVGVETAAPVLSEEVAALNLTNEGGAEGVNRLLGNVMGMWILESCRRRWDQRGAALPYDQLLARLGMAPPFAGFVLPDDDRFFHPDDMALEVCAALRESGQPVPDPDDQVALTRLVLESLALRYATVLESLGQVTGRPVAGVHVIGGGSQNAFLNQATANASGLEVQAGPVEATAAGNVLVQAIADGQFADVAEARRFLTGSERPQCFEPVEQEAWCEARARYRELERCKRPYL